MFYGQQIQGPPNPQQPLSYTGGSPNEVVFDRQPNPTDNNPYLIGCRWTIPVSQTFPTGEFWVLVSLVNDLATWKKLEGHAESAETLTGNTGGAITPDSDNNINVVGTGSISVAGDESTNTLTISAEALTLTGNSGGAVSPDSDNNINVVGTGTLVVTGNPSTHTLTISRTGGTGYIGLINKIYITATGGGTYTPTSGMLQCYVECQAGGGGASGNSADCEAASPGGSAGGYCAKMFTASDIGASKTYSVGAGGAAGGSGGSSVSPNAGSAGGDTTFAGVMTASGGGGGTSDFSFSAGGSASGGDINIAGGAGSSVLVADLSDASIQVSGSGGSSQLGQGGAFQQYGANGVNPVYAGIAGTGYGSGASGPIRASQTGIAGQNGIIIITEYLS